MPHITEVVHDRLDVRETVTLAGIATEGAHVHENGRLVVAGVLNGHLHVDPGGLVSLNGVLSGTADVHGDLDVSGVITGTLRAEGEGRITVAVGAVVNDRRVCDDGRLRSMAEEAPIRIDDSTPRFVWSEDEVLSPAR